MHIALVHRDLHALTRGGIATIYRALAPAFIRPATRSHCSPRTAPRCRTYPVSTPSSWPAPRT